MFARFDGEPGCRGVEAKEGVEGREDAVVVWVVLTREMEEGEEEEKGVEGAAAGEGEEAMREGEEAVRAGRGDEMRACATVGVDEVDLAAKHAGVEEEDIPAASEREVNLKEDQAGETNSILGSAEG